MFVVKQILKMILQHLILPVTYCFWRIVYYKKGQQLIVFADAHHDTIPYSMKNMYMTIHEKGYEIIEIFTDYGKISQWSVFLNTVKFMKIYAQAKYVFICDNFFPVISCKKSKKTKVIQLWHSCGLLKKIGYDTSDDIPKYYLGKVYRNYDLMTVSSPACIEPLTSAMKQPENVVQALGVSRTDTYFNRIWIEKCKKNFYDKYPEAVDKKVVLWAPTFRGNAGEPYQIGTEAILDLEKELGDDFFLIRKVHPHVEAKYHLSNCEISSEELFPVVDVMISDYSSIIFDFLFFEKPYVLFAPDIEQYEKDRGFYVEYETLSPYVVTDKNNLTSSVLSALEAKNDLWLEEQRKFHLSSCDGQVTERILDYLGI